MSDLISREALYKAFSDYLNKTSLGEISPQKELRVGEIASIIKSVPIAFDKEGVIKELEERRNSYDINEEPSSTIGSKEYIWECCDIREHKGKHMAYNDAIDIVEKRRNRVKIISICENCGEKVNSEEFYENGFLVEKHYKCRKCGFRRDWAYGYITQDDSEFAEEGE